MEEGGIIMSWLDILLAIGIGMIIGIFWELMKLKDVLGSTNYTLEQILTQVTVLVHYI